MGRKRRGFDFSSLFVSGSIFLFSCLFLSLLALITSQVAYLKAKEEQKAAQAWPTPTATLPLNPEPSPSPTGAEPTPSPSLTPQPVPGSMGIYLHLTKPPRPSHTSTPTPTSTPTSTSLPVPGPMAMYLFHSKTPLPTPSATRLPTPTPSPVFTSTPAPFIYIVQEGDTLLALARRYGVSVEAIQEANNLLDPGRLQIGQEIIIPQGEETPLKPPVLTPTPTPIWGTVNADILNLRAGPSLDERKIGHLPAGTKLELLGRNEKGDWLWIRTEDGRKGWVAGEFVQTEADLEALPLTF